MVGRKRNRDWLYEGPYRPNLAAYLDDDELGWLGQEVVRGYRLDAADRAEWDEQSAEALALAKQVREYKNFPWEGAASVKYPLITVPAIHFSARAYPEMVGVRQIVTCKAWRREDEERARRVANHMNWQLTVEMEEWCEETDRLLAVLSVLGQCYRKTYYDESLGRVVSRLVLPCDCFVNSKATSLRQARRITHRFLAHTNDVYERQRTGLWLAVDLGLPTTAHGDPDAPHEFIEQHSYFDLDGDGYKEPYIVTVHLASSKVVRVAARWMPDGVVTDDRDRLVRIEPLQFFTHFGFLPNPDGSMNYLGFGQLLEPINATINTCINQLIDCGTLYNAGGGFIGRGVRLRGGTVSFRPGEWKLVDVVGAALKDSIVPLPSKEPSAVLFNLLGFLVQAARDISSVQEVLTGDIKFGPNMPVGTALALVEQSLKVYTAIYRRIYRSLSDEFRKIYSLNAIYTPPHFTFFLAGEEQWVGQSDYVSGDLTVVPNADPTLSTDIQRMLKAQALASFTGRPGLNELEVTRELVRSLSPEVADKVLLTDSQLAGQEPLPWQPGPTPQGVLAQAKALLARARAQEVALRSQLTLTRSRYEFELLLADIAKRKAEAALALARTAETAVDVDTKELLNSLTRLEHQVRSQIEAISNAILGSGVEGLEEAPGDLLGVE